MYEQWPTQNGFALAPNELWLPESSRPTNTNNHHNAWPRRLFTSCVLLQTFRDLESNQFRLPCDVHAWLHNEYEPPKPPTPSQAYEHILMAAEAGDELHIYREGQYIRRSIGKTTLRKCLDNYHAFKHYRNVNW